MFDFYLRYTFDIKSTVTYITKFGPRCILKTRLISSGQTIQSSEECRWYFRGGSRTVATFKMERFVIIVNSFQPLTIITKRSILDVAAALDPPLFTIRKRYNSMSKRLRFPRLDNNKT